MDLSDQKMSGLQCPPSVLQIHGNIQIYLSKLETNSILHLSWSPCSHTNPLLIIVQDQSQESQPELGTVPGSQAG